MKEEQNEINDATLYDEFEAVAYIRKQLKGNKSIEALSDDELMLILDTTYEFCETRGLTSITDEEDPEFDDVEIDIEEVYDYVIRECKKNDSPLSISLEDYVLIYDADTDYVESIIGEDEE